ncbi:hypothetical protein QTN25_007711 [Entamoeba marina]
MLPQRTCSSALNSTTDDLSISSLNSCSTLPLALETVSPMLYTNNSSLSPCSDESEDEEIVSILLHKPSTKYVVVGDTDNMISSKRISFNDEICKNPGPSIEMFNFHM